MQKPQVQEPKASFSIIHSCSPYEIAHHFLPQLLLRVQASYPEITTDPHQRPFWEPGKAEGAWWIHVPGGLALVKIKAFKDHTGNAEFTISGLHPDVPVNELRDVFKKHATDLFMALHTNKPV